MRIAVCEDNQSDSAILCAYIESYCGKHCYHSEIAVFGSGEAFLTAFSPGIFDLIFLDIYCRGFPAWTQRVKSGKPTMTAS